MAAMQAHDRGCGFRPPLQHVETQMPRNDVSRHISNAWVVRYTEVRSAFEQALEFVCGTHVERPDGRRKLVQVHVVLFLLVAQRCSERCCVMAHHIDIGGGWTVRPRQRIGIECATNARARIAG